MYEFDVEDRYNIFGAGHRLVVSLYKDGSRLRSWEYDTALGIGAVLAKKKIKNLQCLYGAKRK